MSIFSFSTMYAILAVMVVVTLAPARISWGACVCFMASSWRGFKVERRESREIDTTYTSANALNAACTGSLKNSICSLSITSAGM